MSSRPDANSAGKALQKLSFQKLSFNDWPKGSKRKTRSNKGNMLIFITVVTVVIVIALLFFLLGYFKFFFGQSEQVNALEAGALTAARELSRIVIEDDHFGFISLSDYPPIGQGTRAADNQPLPVFGINSILATVRLDLIIAHELQNPVMIALAERDAVKAREAVESLNQALLSAISGGSAQDLDGNSVDVAGAARASYEENLARNTTVSVANPDSFELSLGWIAGGAPTITDIPRPHNKSQVDESSRQNGCYRAYINIPAHGHDFYFAGIGERAQLVDGQKWREADGTRALSAVRAVSIHSVHAAAGGASGVSAGGEVRSIACALPSANRDNSPPGELAVGFPHGRVPGILTIRNLLDDSQLKLNPMPMFTPQGGDWPGGGPLSGPITISGLGGSGPGGSAGGSDPSVSEGIAMGLFDWIRSSRSRMRIDAVQNLLDLELFSAIPGASNVPPEYQAYTFSGCPGSADDPRMLAILGNSNDATTAYLNMSTLGDVWNFVPLNSTTLKGNDSGANMSTSGAGFDNAILDEFWSRLKTSNLKAWEAYNLARQILDNTHDSTGQPYTADTKDRAQILKKRAAWIIYASYHISRQLLDLSAHGLSKSGDETYDTTKFIFNNPTGGDWKLVFDSSPGASGAGADKIIMVETSLSESAVKSSSTFSNALMNDQSKRKWGGSHTHIPPAIVSANGFFFAGNYSDSYNLPDPHSSMTIGTPGGTGADTTPNPNPSSSLHNEMHLRLDNDGSVRLSYALSPFVNLPISERQIYGIALNAKTVGTGNQVTWTAIVRDQVRNLGRSSGGRHGGQPLAGAPPDYVNNPAFGGVNGTSSLSWDGNNFRLGNVLDPQPRDNYMSGGLAVEIQLRNPIVLKCNQTPENISGDGSNNTSLLPPVPANML